MSAVLRALFCDLDGTLLTSSRTLSPTTRVALAACRRAGIRVFAATARPPRLGRMLGLSPDDELLLSDGGAFYNGGCIICNGLKEYAPIAGEAVEKAIRLTHAWPDVNLAVQMTGERHGFRHPIPEDDHAAWGINPSDVIPLRNVPLTDVVKLLLFSSLRPLEEVFTTLSSALGSQLNVYLTGSGSHRFVEVVDRDVSKKYAVDRIAATCGFSSDEVAVFGDDHNDIEMLSAFKHSVAMGNAGCEVKGAARHITLSNDDDGVVHALRNIFGLGASCGES